jgi:hypothetical protein
MSSWLVLVGYWLLYILYAKANRRRQLSSAISLFSPRFESTATGCNPATACCSWSGLVPTGWEELQLFCNSCVVCAELKLIFYLGSGERKREGELAAHLVPGWAGATRFAPEMTIKSRELRAKYCAEVLNFKQKNIWQINLSSSTWGDSKTRWFINHHIYKRN